MKCGPSFCEYNEEKRPIETSLAITCKAARLHP